MKIEHVRHASHRMSSGPHELMSTKEQNGSEFTAQRQECRHASPNGGIHASTEEG